MVQPNETVKDAVLHFYQPCALLAISQMHKENLFDLFLGTGMLIRVYAHLKHSKVVEMEVLFYYFVHQNMRFVASGKLKSCRYLFYIGRVTGDVV